ncbi:MAG: hypothetical protein K2X39_06720 [Silvanigrellaceae bacterium]|nr:hypothetical protein [Silvanigrellaceae bacterium]
MSWLIKIKINEEIEFSDPAVYCKNFEFIAKLYKEIASKKINFEEYTRLSTDYIIRAISNVKFNVPSLFLKHRMSSVFDDDM